MGCNNCFTGGFRGWSQYLKNVFLNFSAVEDCNKGRIFFRSCNLHAIIKAAVFLPVLIFEKGSETPSCSVVQQLLVSRDRFVLAAFSASPPPP